MLQANNPFSTGAVKTVRTKSGCRTRLNPEDLEIADDPLPKRRLLGSQYDSIFSKMKVGQCIKVDAEHVGAVANAMRSWIRRNKKQRLAVKSVKKYARCRGELGRVWLIEKPPAASTAK